MEKKIDLIKAILNELGFENNASNVLDLNKLPLRFLVKLHRVLIAKQCQKLVL